jgi:hypothetical protein
MAVKSVVDDFVCRTVINLHFGLPVRQVTLLLPTISERTSSVFSPVVGAYGPLLWSSG